MLAGQRSIVDDRLIICLVDGRPDGHLTQPKEPSDVAHNASV
jgi:hypothetical protein